jgi:hypothetical protein
MAQMPCEHDAHNSRKAVCSVSRPPLARLRGTAVAGVSCWSNGLLTNGCENLEHGQIDELGKQIRYSLLDTMILRTRRPRDRHLRRP